MFYTELELITELFSNPLAHFAAWSKNKPEALHMIYLHSFNLCSSIKIQSNKDVLIILVPKKKSTPVKLAEDSVAVVESDTTDDEATEETPKVKKTAKKSQRELFTQKIYTF